jgi:hypothetical protein
MKTILTINWLLSMCSLCIDTERSPFWAVLACAAWFCVSAVLLRLSERKTNKTKQIKT